MGIISNKSKQKQKPKPNKPIWLSKQNKSLLKLKTSKPNTKIEVFNENYINFMSIMTKAEDLRQEVTIEIMNFYYLTGGIVLKDPSLDVCIMNFYIYLRMLNKKNTVTHSKDSPNIDYFDYIKINTESYDNDYILIDIYDYPDEVYDIIQKMNLFIKYSKSIYQSVESMYILILKINNLIEECNSNEYTEDKSEEYKTNKEVINIYKLSFQYFTMFFNYFNSNIINSLNLIYSSDYKMKINSYSLVAVSNNLSNVNEISWEFSNSQRRLLHYKEYITKYNLTYDNIYQTLRNNTNYNDNDNINQTQIDQSQTKKRGSVSKLKPSSSPKRKYKSNNSHIKELKRIEDPNYLGNKFNLSDLDINLDQIQVKEEEINDILKETKEIQCKIREIEEDSLRKVKYFPIFEYEKIGFTMNNIKKLSIREICPSLEGHILVNYVYIDEINSLIIGSKSGEIFLVQNGKTVNRMSIDKGYIVRFLYMNINHYIYFITSEKRIGRININNLNFNFNSNISISIVYDLSNEIHDESIEYYSTYNNSLSYNKHKHKHYHKHSIPVKMIRLPKGEEFIIVTRKRLLKFNFLTNRVETKKEDQDLYYVDIVNTQYDPIIVSVQSDVIDIYNTIRLSSISIQKDKKNGRDLISFKSYEVYDVLIKDVEKVEFYIVELVSFENCVYLDIYQVKQSIVSEEVSGNSIYYTCSYIKKHIVSSDSVRIYDTFNRDHMFILESLNGVDIISMNEDDNKNRKGINKTSRGDRFCYDKYVNLLYVNDGRSLFLFKENGIIEYWSI